MCIFLFNKIFDNKLFDPDLVYGKTYTWEIEGTNETLYEGDEVVVSKPANYDRPLYVSDSYDNSKNQFTFDVKVMNSGVDVSNKYEISYDFGLLRVDPATISVQCKYASKIYDGNGLEIVSGTFEVTTGTASKGVYISNYTKIPEGYKVICSSTYSGQTYLAGNYIIPLEIHLYDETGNDYNPNNVNFYVSSNPKVQYIVKKRECTITTQGGNVSFRPIGASEKRTVTGLASGDKILFGEEEWSASKDYYVSVPNMVEPGEYYNEVGAYHIMRGNVDVTSCYNVTTNVGKVIIS